MLLSPEVRNAIHVGDRILEINGLPVGTMMEAEVGLNLTHVRSTQEWLASFTLSFFLSFLNADAFLQCLARARSYKTTSPGVFGIPLIPLSWLHSSSGSGLEVE